MLGHDGAHFDQPPKLMPVDAYSPPRKASAPFPACRGRELAGEKCRPRRLQSVYLRFRQVIRPAKLAETRLSSQVSRDQLPPIRSTAPDACATLFGAKQWNEARAELCAAATKFPALSSNAHRCGFSNVEWLRRRPVGDQRFQVNDPTSTRTALFARELFRSRRKRLP